MKIYKIYAQCVRNPHPITEITEQQTYVEIRHIIDEYIETELFSDLYNELVSEENFEIDSDNLYNAIANLFYKFWENNNFVDCGDYMIIKSDTDFCNLSRPNACGFMIFTSREIRNEFNRVKEHNQ